MLVTARRSSSSCTGAFTSEMALAALENAVNCPRRLSKLMSVKPISCHELRMTKTSFCYSIVFIIGNVGAFTLVFSGCGKTLYEMCSELMT